MPTHQIYSFSSDLRPRASLEFELTSPTLATSLNLNASKLPEPMNHQISKKDSNGNTLPPQRIDSHRIDTDALRVVRTKLTPDWIERSVEERDYGIDMMLETFDGNNPTGILVLLQVKGHEGSFGSGDVALSVPVKTLLYARMFQTPFFLLTVSNADRQVHFVWLQKYINTRLTEENSRWNKQESVTIHFPKDNVLNEAGLAKIRALVTYVAHRDMGIQFLRHLTWLKQHVEDFFEGGAGHSLEQAIVRLKDIEKLEPFLATYEEFTDGLDIEKMTKALAKAKSYNEFDFGDDTLVSEQLSHLHAIGMMFLSKDEIDTSVAENTDSNFPY